MPPDVQYTKTLRKDVKGRVIYQSAKGADKVRCKDAATGKMVWKKPPAAAKAKKPTMRKTPAPKATRRCNESPRRRTSVIKITTSDIVYVDGCSQAQPLEAPSVSNHHAS